MMSKTEKTAIKTTGTRLTWLMAGIKKYWFKVVCLAMILTALAAAALIWSGGRDKIIKAEAAVVLGSEVFRDGRPSPRLAARLDKSLELYRAGHCRIIIVSGGVGLSEVDEATAMAAYLRAKGVPPENLVVDSQGLNTWRTAEFAAEYVKAHDIKGIIAVSQHFHIPRSVMALRIAGCPEVGQASPDYWEARDIYSVAREIPANIFYWWKYKVNGSHDPD